MPTTVRPNNRPPVDMERVEKIYQNSLEHYKNNRARKGPGIFQSTHEGLGCIDIEFNVEYKNAVHNEPKSQQIRELYDVITACVHQIASMETGLQDW